MKMPKPAKARAAPQGAVPNLRSLVAGAPQIVNVSGGTHGIKAKAPDPRPKLRPRRLSIRGRTAFTGKNGAQGDGAFDASKLAEPAQAFSDTQAPGGGGGAGPPSPPGLGG